MKSEYGSIGVNETKLQVDVISEIPDLMIILKTRKQAEQGDWCLTLFRKTIDKLMTYPSMMSSRPWLPNNIQSTPS